MKKQTSKVKYSDADFLSDLRSAALQGPRFAYSVLLMVVVLFFIALITWAYYSEIDEVTKGQGKVIPSGHPQIVQNLEGGIVAEILVREGEIVQQDDVLLRIDDTRFSADFRENNNAYHSYLVKAARLRAEAENRKADFSSLAQDELKEYANLVLNEKALYRSRKIEFESSLGVLSSQLKQKQQELVELRRREKQLRDSYALVSKQVAIVRPLVAEGAASQVELLKLQREVNDIKGTMEATRLSIPRSKSAIIEAQQRLSERKGSFRNEALNELAEATFKIKALRETLTRAEDKVRRTEVRSPVKGTIKQVMINTVGGVVKPGMDLVEIIPIEDNLLVEAQIRPSDIAFLHPGQHVMVKITAYDFSIYGGLDATLERIGVDTIEDQRERNKSYYKIQVRTKKNYLGTVKKPLPIIPGMVAEINILTGKKSVLDYLLKPILKTRQNALRER